MPSPSAARSRGSRRFRPEFWIPTSKYHFQFFVEHFGPCLEQEMCSTESPLVAVGMSVARHPLGGRRQSPAPGSHRTQRADFPHWALQTLIHSMAIACSSW